MPAWFRSGSSSSVSESSPARARVVPADTKFSNGTPSKVTVFPVSASQASFTAWKPLPSPADVSAMSQPNIEMLLPPRAPRHFAC